MIHGHIAVGKRDYTFSEHLFWNVIALCHVLRIYLQLYRVAAGENSCILWQHDDIYGCMFWVNVPVCSWGLYSLPEDYCFTYLEIRMFCIYLQVDSVWTVSRFAVHAVFVLRLIWFRPCLVAVDRGSNRTQIFS
jgi:hypothetical protein